MVKKIVCATNNKDKLREIKSILKDVEIYSLSDVGIDVDVIEDGKTFEENAKKKSYEIFQLIKMPVLADDSGLCISYLNGFPGVESKRFLDNIILDHESTPEERNLYLIDKLRGLNKDDRSAIFKCVIAYYDGNDFIIGNGEIKGTISTEMRGTNGFGFDSIFMLNDGRMMAELSASEKNEISHRKRALEGLLMKFEKNV